MSTTRDLLIEIGTEELPPKALLKLSQAFTAGVTEGLAKAGLAHGAIHPYASPRRLAMLVTDLQTAQPARSLERRGPALAAAYDAEGCATPAALGFAKSCGVAVEDLEKLETDKGAWLVHRSEQPGQDTAALIPDIVSHALARLPIPKRMRWGASSVEFVRPVHWAVLLFGDTVIDAEILGARAERMTFGHRFHHPDGLYLGEAAGYAALLETEGRVIADFATRREAVRAQVLEAAAKVGGRAVIDDDLLDEVTALVEWPVAVTGSFDKRFLDVPQEALISTMRGNQKYFHVVDEQGRLQAHFITLANIDSRDPAQIIAGNERVIRPRFADAAFFWEQDCKRGLASRIEPLQNVVFQDKLGTLHDKCVRVEKLARAIAGQIGGDEQTASRAAQLAKCDLLTDMVGEFPELQGTMGRYYANHDGELAEVAAALEEQYQPRFAGDTLPVTATGRALAMADRLDTLCGIFSIGLKPTGDKDPFALRRAALGVLRILIEAKLDLDLAALLNQACAALPGKPAKDTQTAVFDYMMERLRAYYADAGVRPDEFEAVLALAPTRPLDFDQRVRAVRDFRALPAAESLAAANKRIRNILKQAGDPAPVPVKDSLLQDAAEQALAKQLAALAPSVDNAILQGDYSGALTQLAGLREAVDKFFDDVMVMVDDSALRDNRIALLNQLGHLFLRVADVSRLQG